MGVGRVNFLSQELNQSTRSETAVEIFRKTATKIIFERWDVYDCAKSIPRNKIREKESELEKRKET